MKIKTSELTGAALDWAVAKIEEHAWAVYDHAVYNEHDVIPTRPSEYLRDCKFGPEFSPTTSWAQGGPLIERERMTVTYDDNDDAWEAFYGVGMNDDDYERGPTPLIAAMRCLVASKLGDEVEVPGELV